MKEHRRYCQPLTTILKFDLNFCAASCSYHEQNIIKRPKYHMTSHVATDMIILLLTLPGCELASYDDNNIYTPLISVDH